MDKGCVHLYCGGGKGKTTAAMGLALRALGRGKTAVLIQFLKDGSSGEIAPLRALGATVLTGPPNTKFVSRMSVAEKLEAAAWNDRNLALATRMPCDLLILDEICAARRYGLADLELTKKTVLERPAGCEVVLTGREPEPWMREAADYLTEMICLRHPYASGLPARKGIEF